MTTLQHNPQFDYADAQTVTPSDSGTLPVAPCRGLWVSAGGTLTVITSQGTTVSLGTVPVGMIQISCNQVKTTGTTATVLALY